LKQLAIKSLCSFPPHSSSVSALPGEIRTNEILHFYLMVLLLNLNNAQKHILFTFLTLWLALYLTVQFSAACNKTDRNVGPLCKHKHEDDFSIHSQQYR